MKSIFLRIIVVALLMGPMATAHADLILQDTGDNSFSLWAYGLAGQSFTAEDEFVKFAFYFVEYSSIDPNGPLQIRLLSGDGLAGGELGSFGLLVPLGHNGFFDVDLSSIALDIGQQYTAELSMLGETLRWGVVWAREDPYSGGRAHFTSSTVNDDMRFRVTPVPIPVALWLFGSGLLGLVGVARRRK